MIYSKLFIHPFQTSSVKIVSILIIFFLLNNDSLAVTETTTLNCPAEYDVNNANVSRSTKSIQKFFYSAFDNDEYRQKVQKIVIEGKSTQLTALINQLMIPYIAVAAAFFLFFMIVVCCSMFEKSCPPCESWKRDFTRRPYERFEMRCVMVFTLIFAISVFVLSIVTFTQFPLFKQQMLNTKCSLFNMLDVTSNGQQSKKWGGFSKLKDQVGNISSLLTTASSEVNKNFKGFDGLSDDDWIIIDMEKMKKSNLDIYKNNKDSKVTTPNPATTDATPIGSALPVVDSLFVKTGLGPNGTDNTMVTDIDSSLRMLQILSQQAYLIEKQSLILVDSAPTITANANSSQQILSMYQKQLTEVKSQMDEFNNEYFAKLLNWGFYVIQGVVGFILAASVFIIFGVVSTHILDIMSCRTMVTLGWIIYSLMYFGIIALVFLFLSLGSVGFSFCNYFDLMVSNQAQFNKITQTYSQNVFAKLDTCLYGNGNVLEKFNIAQQMDTVTKVFTNIQLYYDYENNQSVRFISKTNSVNKIQGWIDAMEKYRIGVYNDSDKALTTDDNYLYSLDNLVKNTKYHYPNGTLHPGCPRDVWVLDSVNCSDPSGEVYRSNEQQSNGLRFTIMNDLCISFNQKFISNYNNIWNLNDFTKRYQQIIHSCPSYSDIIRYGRALINYRNSRQNLFQGIKDQLVSLKSSNVQFNTNLNSYKSRVDTFYSSVSTLNNLVTDKISGLLVSSNCNVIGDYLKVINNVLCHNVMGHVVSLGICCVLLSCMMIGGIITASVFSTRYARIDNTNKHSTRVVIPETSILSETFQKKQQQSDSSSSSSDED